MYLSKIKLRNIRGFAELDFDLSRGEHGYSGWTVFTGNNGAGKSTLLKAIAIGLVGPDTGRALQPSFRGWLHKGMDTGGSSIELEIARVDGDDDLKESGRRPITEFPARILVTNGGKETALSIGLPTKKPKNYATPQRSIWANDAKGWFSCGYGPYRRMFGASPDATRQMVGQLTGRFVTMFNEAASLSEVDQWLRQLKHQELEERPGAKQQLDMVLAILRDDLLPNQFAVDRVDADGLWLKDRHGTELPWADMSDGYRSAVALLADILRHFIDAYGADNLVDKIDGRPVVTRSGVVLIDEIDSHLHPEWQQRIGFWLIKHFPKVQFLVTSHSPLVLQAASPNGLFVLPEPGSDAAPRALTKRRAVGHLSGDEERKVRQLELFVNRDEET